MRSRSIAVALALLSLLAAGLAYLVLAPAPQGASVAPLTPPREPPRASIAHPTEPPRPAETVALRTDPAEPARPLEPARGTVVVELARPAEFPAGAIEVHAHAWRTHAGAPARGVARADVAAQESRTELSLPGGSFALSARGAGWTSSVVRVDLDVRSPTARVELRLLPCAGLRGLVLGHDGQGAADLPVHFVDEDGQWLADAVTDPAGAYAFDCLPPVSGRIAPGALAGPLVAPLEARASVPPSRVADVTLPPMGALRIEAVDEFGAPVPRLALQGLSDSSVRLEFESDAFGIATAAHVPAGLWRIFGDGGALGRGTVALEVAVGTQAQARLSLRR
jgi:hypothetical protein